MKRSEVRAALMNSSSNSYDLHLGTLIRDTSDQRVWVVPFGLAMRCWPASPDSPVVLEQIKVAGVWVSERAYRLRDDIPVDPPFDSTGRCWTVLPRDTPREPMEAYVFSTQATAAAVLSATPRHLSQNMEIFEAATTTPWRSSQRPHAIYFS